jgi:hypothetical protein
MVLKYFILSIISLFIYLQSCDRVTQYDEDSLTYKNQFIFEKQFDMSGYYKHEDVKDSSLRVRYFFQNGSFFRGAYDLVKKNDSGCFDVYLRDRPYVWGYFIVEDGVVKVQSYDPTSLSASNEFKVVEMWFSIINDSTLHEFRYIDRNGKSSSVDREYTLVKCSPKPDSTNILMD